MFHLRMKAKRPSFRTAARAVALGLLITTTPAAMSCYGRFPLTRAIYRFNGDVSDNKFIRSLVFWVFIWIPVYGVAAFADAIIFNLIEFWTGEAMEISSGTNPDGSTYSFVPSPDGKDAVLTVTKDGAILTQQTFHRVSPGIVEVRDMFGKLHGSMVKAENGDLELLNARGETVRTVSASDLHQLKM